MKGFNRCLYQDMYSVPSCTAASSGLADGKLGKLDALRGPECRHAPHAKTEHTEARPACLGSGGARRGPQLQPILLDIYSA